MVLGQTRTRFYNIDSWLRCLAWSSVPTPLKQNYVGRTKTISQILKTFSTHSLICWKTAWTYIFLYSLMWYLIMSMALAHYYVFSRKIDLHIIHQWRVSFKVFFKYWFHQWNIDLNRHIADSNGQPYKFIDKGCWKNLICNLDRENKMLHIHNLVGRWALLPLI